MVPNTEVECWLSAKLTPDQYLRLQEIANVVHPGLSVLEAGELVPDLLRDVLAHALFPLLDELVPWEAWQEE